MPLSAFRLCQSAVALLPIAIAVSVFPGCGGSTALDGDGGGATSGGDGSTDGGASGGTGTGATGLDASGGSDGGSMGSGGASTGGSDTGGTSGGDGGGASANPDCNLEVEVGPCEAAIRRYFYNPSTGLCEPFTYGGCEGNDNNFESLGACDDACRDGKPTPLDHCDQPADCVLEPMSCCGVCEPGRLSDFQAIHQAYRSEQQARVASECPEIPCGPCIPADPVSQNFGVTCENHRCVAFDVRDETDLSGCQQDSDCRLRSGLHCCEGCGGDWVAVSSQHAELGDVLCGGAPTTCPECDAILPAGLTARCEDGTCQVHQTTIDCNCVTGAYLPVCGTDGQTHDASCGDQCVPVDIACEGECPCPN